MTTQIPPLESTPAMTEWFKASNTLSAYCEILEASKMVHDDEADYRLQEAIALVTRLSKECDSATVKIMEEFDELRKANSLQPAANL